MILVTGTKRSGTSMWMQVLIAAGFTPIGEAFPSVWEKSIRDANPRGFFESRFRNGVWWATNPDRETGHYLPPHNTRQHVVKVFTPGVVRTDLAYVDRVVATVRDWREYIVSVDRLFEMEDAFVLEQEDGAERVAQLQQRRRQFPAHIEWWLENYELVKDVSIRRYPMHMTSYAAMLDDPRFVLRRCLKWLGGGDLEAAVAAVDPALRTQHAGAAPLPEQDEDLFETFDAYYQQVHRGGSLPKALLEQMNATQAVVAERYGLLPRNRVARAGIDDVEGLG